ncbi:MAG: ABC-F family ATP-binding cassette domain-containing protein [Saprospiraceae bacterium]
MNYLTLEKITKIYGEKTLFNNISLHIDKGQKIALIAKNGSGKSTLMRVIAGQDGAEGEHSKVLFRKNIKIGFLHQEPDFDPEHGILDAIFDSTNPLIQAIKAYEEALIFSDKHEHMQAAMARMEELKAWEVESRINEILSKFKILNLDQKVKTLSGGQKKRLALAKLIIEEPDFMILDEPTNHLDLDMIEWLEKYLQQPNLTVFMVTHDRYFLENVTDTFYELEGGELFKYKGNYSAYLEKKAIRTEVEGASMDKNRKLLSKELEWVRRQPQARGTKAKSRVDAFYSLKEETAKVGDNTSLEININTQRIGSKIVELHNVSKAFGDKKIIDRFEYKFKRKERLGIVGPNGAGKSTFIKLLTQEIKPDTGKVVVGETIVFGHYNQDGMSLRDDKRVIEVITDIAEYIPLEKGQKLTATSLLEKFLFSRAQQQVYVSQLSGGEKRRLYLLTILMTNPNFLILDEPTNDLDILTINVLEDFLMDYPGCLIVVTHDRFFMDKMVDHLFIFEGEGKIKDYNGQYSDYRADKNEEDAEERRLKNELEKKASSNQVNSQLVSKLSGSERKEFGQIEKEIAKLEKKKIEITDKFNDPQLSNEEMMKYSMELGTINDMIESKEMRWMELAEKDAQ